MDEIPEFSRQRLQKQEAESMGQMLEARGFTVKIHSMNQKIAIWKINQDESGESIRTWVGEFNWEMKKGWRLDLAQPFIYTQADFKATLDQIEFAHKAMQVTDAAWKGYDNKRNDITWQTYRRTVAAHQAGTFDMLWHKEV